MSARILVVEDNPDARELLVMVLAHAGYQIIEASNGSEALHNAATYHPDLILMDLGLPGMRGYEVMNQMRSDPRLASIPIVITTAFDRTSDIR
jgi:CheY-like chemotaxis protein